MKHTEHKTSDKEVKKKTTWDDIVGIAGYKGPRKSIREIQLESTREKKK